MYYQDYLQLDKLLDAQHPESFKEGNKPAHDEMLFITVHQAYEIWFKQILFELDFIMRVFDKTHIDDNSEDLNLVRHRLGRIIKILELLNMQISVLDTMTPLDFLEFRNLLTPASGFQSVQFRFIEARLGLKMDERFGAHHYKRTNEGGFSQADRNKINTSEKNVSLLEQIDSWLARLPFFNIELWRNYELLTPPRQDLHPFWNDYRKLYQSGLSEIEAGRINDFDQIFSGIRNREKNAQEEFSSLSAMSLRAALFIMLYRDFPVFQTSYRILDSLIEIDHQLATWRHKHIVMVRRMIGQRVGTGNTTGEGYLQGALNSHYIFRDIAALSTFLIERNRLPKLPGELIEKLSYSS